jgi:hypothetical protein
MFVKVQLTATISLFLVNMIQGGQYKSTNNALKTKGHYDDTTPDSCWIFQRASGGTESQCTGVGAADRRDLFGSDNYSLGLFILALSTREAEALKGYAIRECRISHDVVIKLKALVEQKVATHILVDTLSHTIQSHTKFISTPEECAAFWGDPTRADADFYHFTDHVQQLCHNSTACADKYPPTETDCSALGYVKSVHCPDWTSVQCKTKYKFRIGCDCTDAERERKWPAVINTVDVCLRDFPSLMKKSDSPKTLIELSNKLMKSESDLCAVEKQASVTAAFTKEKCGTSFSLKTKSAWETEQTMDDALSLHSRLMRLDDATLWCDSNYTCPFPSAQTLGSKGFVALSACDKVAQATCEKDYPCPTSQTPSPISFPDAEAKLQTESIRVRTFCSAQLPNFVDKTSSECKPANLVLHPREKTCPAPLITQDELKQVITLIYAGKNDIVSLSEAMENNRCGGPISKYTSYMQRKLGMLSVNQIIGKATVMIVCPLIFGWSSIIVIVLDTFIGWSLQSCDNHLLVAFQSTQSKGGFTGDVTVGEINVEEDACIYSHVGKVSRSWTFGKVKMISTVVPVANTVKELHFIPADDNRCSESDWTSSPGYWAEVEPWENKHTESSGLKLPFWPGSCPDRCFLFHLCHYWWSWTIAFNNSEICTIKKSTPTGYSVSVMEETDGVVTTHDIVVGTSASSISSFASIELISVLPLPTHSLHCGDLSYQLNEGFFDSQLLTWPINEEPNWKQMEGHVHHSKFAGSIEAVTWEISGIRGAFQGASLTMMSQERDLEFYHQAFKARVFLQGKMDTTEACLITGITSAPEVILDRNGEGIQAHDVTVVSIPCAITNVQAKQGECHATIQLAHMNEKTATAIVYYTCDHQGLVEFTIPVEMGATWKVQFVRGTTWNRDLKAGVTVIDMTGRPVKGSFLLNNFFEGAGKVFGGILKLNPLLGIFGGLWDFGSGISGFWNKLKYAAVVLAVGLIVYIVHPIFGILVIVLGMIVIAQASPVVDLRNDEDLMVESFMYWGFVIFAVYRMTISHFYTQSAPMELLKGVSYLIVDVPVFVNIVLATVFKKKLLFLIGVLFSRFELVFLDVILQVASWLRRDVDWAYASPLAIPSLYTNYKSLSKLLSSTHYLFIGMTFLSVIQSDTIDGWHFLYIGILAHHFVFKVRWYGFKPIMDITQWGAAKYDIVVRPGIDSLPDLGGEPIKPNMSNKSTQACGIPSCDSLCGLVLDVEDEIERSVGISTQ